MSLAEYLALDAAGEVKHEYLDRAASSMARRTIEHGAIAANIIRHLGTALRARPCQVFTSDVRVAVEATGLRTYPAVTVVCGEIRRTDEALSVINDGTWTLRALRGDAVLELAALSCGLPLDEVYLKIELAR